MVGCSPLHLEPPRLSLDSLVGPMDPLCTASSASLDFLSVSTITDVPAALGAQSTDTGLCGSDFADIPDAELEKILSPFCRDDQSSDLEYWDLELLMAS